jgi:hypothetical protein
MVGVINPANGTSLDKQREAAKDAPFQLLPGEPWPAENNTPGTGTTISPPLSFPSIVSHDHRPSKSVLVGAIGGPILLLSVVGIISFSFRYLKLYMNNFKDEEHGDTLGEGTDGCSQPVKTNAPDTHGVSPAITIHFSDETVGEKSLIAIERPAISSNQPALAELEGDLPKIPELSALS